MSGVDPTPYEVPPLGPGDEPLVVEGVAPPGGPPPPDRRPWIIGGLAALVVIVGLLLVLLGDGDDDDVATDTSTSSTSSTSSTTSTSARPLATSTTATTVAVAPAPTTAPPPPTSAAPVEPPTTLPPAPTTTAPPPPVVVNPVLCTAAGDNPDRPDFAAQAVHEAFLRGDEACAAELMTDDAHRVLFAMTPASRQLRECTEQPGTDPPTECVFVGPDVTALHLVMSFSDTDDVWQVSLVEESTG